MKKLLALIGIGLISFVGQAQTAVDFDGSNYIQTQPIPALTDFTVEFDIRYDGPGTGATYQRILSTFNNGFSIALDGTGPGTVQVYSNDWPAPWTMVGYSLPLGTWVHMAWVKQGANLSLYVDGAFVSTTAVGAGGTVSSAWYLSANQANFTENANSTMDNFRIWDDVRTPAEIAANYNICLTGSEANLIVLYDMEEGAGTTTNDLATGDGVQDGTLTGGPVWTGGVACSAPVATNDHYWVGGTGNWSDAANHWASTSGGAPGSSTVPTIGNNAIFDDNSGLTAVDVVNVDVIVDVDTLNFSAVSNSFVFNNSGNNITIEYSLVGNTSGVTFTGTWGEIIFNAGTPGETITSGGTTWMQDFRITGTEPITLVDNLNISTGIMFVDNGGLDLSGNDLTCAEFQSTTASAKTINIGGSVVTVTNGLWDVNGTGLTLTSASSTILMGDNAGLASFTGGALAYDTLRSISAIDFSYYDDNTFSLFEVPLSTELSINNGDDLSSDSLIIYGTCGARLTLNTTGAGQNGTITKTGYPVLNLLAVDITKVNAIAPAVYNLQISSVTNATGWTLSAVKFYWIGDAGDWNDGNHWAFSSGGPSTGCIPTASDSVFFDANSFSLIDQIVLVDDTAFFRSMDWTGITGTQTLALDSSMWSYGDVILHPNLTLKRNTSVSGLQFNEKSDLWPSLASIDCAFNIALSNATDSVKINGADLIMSDTSAIILFNGRFITQDFDIRTGTILSIDDSGSGTDDREINMGSSFIHVLQQFSAVNDPAISLTPGTSHLYVGDTVQTVPTTISYGNNLLTEGLTFYDVTLNFQPLNFGGVPLKQTVQGDNTINKFTILPGSHVYFDSTSTQVVSDSLIWKGNCLDSIHVFSNSVSVQSSITKTTSTDVKAECLVIADIDMSDPQTALYSTDNGNNNNWTFSATSPVTALFTIDSLFCFGDTTVITNNSTSASSLMSFSWNYGDQSFDEFTGSAMEAEQSTTITYPQVAGTDTSAYSVLLNWNEISDPQSLFEPTPGIAKTIQGAESMKFDFTVGYDLSLVNSTGSNAYLVDMDSLPTLVSYNYRPRIRIFKNGTPYSSSGNTMQIHKYYEDSLVPGSTSIGTDTLSFSVFVYGVLPTDSLTVYIGSNVTYTSNTLQPRWKDDSLRTATDVAIDYKLDIDTIHFTATPISSNYTADTAYHQFTTAQDSMFVTLIATDQDNLCSDTLTLPVSIYNPQVYMSTNEFDLTICQGDEVTFDASSTDDSTRFQFYVNGVAQNSPPSINDTIFTTTSLVDGDTIQLAGFEQGCKSTSVPTIYFNVDSLPVFTWTSTDADTSICALDVVSFDAITSDTTNTFQYLINYSSVSGYTQDGLYSTSAFTDNDTISLVGLNTEGCRDTLNMIFNVDPLPATTLNDSLYGSTVICSGTQVLFTAGGATTYEFFVNGVSQGAPSATTTWSTTTLTGNDTVTVVGYFATGCSKEAAQFYRYNVLPSPTVNLLSSDTDFNVCSGENVTFTGTGASQYDFIINGTSVTGGFLPSSTYSTTSLLDGDVVELIGLSSSGCTDTTSTITFTVVASPTTALASSDVDQIICSGDTVTFTGSGATNYEFFVDGVSQGASSATTTFVTSTLTDNQIVTVNGESNGCIVTDNLTFDVLPIPNVNLFSSDPDDIICDGDAISLTGTNANQYELFINDVSQGLPQASATFVNPSLGLGSNTVYLIGTAPNGCTNSSDSIDIQVNAIPTVTNTSSDIDNIICAGEAVTFTGAGSDLYQFYVDGTPQGSYSATNTFTSTTLANGQTVSILGSTLGCVDTSNLIVTTVNAVPVVTLTNTDPNNSWCVDQTVSFTANGASNYEFFVDGVSQGASSPTNTLSSTGFVVGTYNVQVVGESANCTNSTNNTITVNPLPTPTITSSDVDNTICAGETVTYTGTGGSLYEFFINGTSQGAATSLAQFSSSTLADGDVVSIVATSSAGCVAPASATAITVNPNPTVVLTSSDIDQQICSGDNVDFTGSGATDYEFFVNGISQGAPSATTTFSTTSLSQGDVIEVIGSSLGCESSSNSMTFTVFGAPIVSLLNNGDSQICVGENTDLTATGAANYQFSVNGVPTGAFSATDTYTGTLNDGDIVTVAGETNGCSSTSADSFTFTVYNYPTLTSSSSDVDNIICLNDLVTITASGAMEYEFLINGTQIQYGALSTFDVSTLQDGDVLSAIGYNGDCPSTADTYTFTVNSMNLDLTASPSSMICTGENVTFTATGGDEYEFFLNGVSTGAMSATNTYSSTTLNDMDEVTVTAYSNSTMCTQVYSDYILMNVIDEPVITPQSAIDFCEGDSVVLVSNMAYGNQWYVDGTAISGATDTAYVAYTSGQYTLEATSGGTGTVWSFGHNPTGSFGNGDNLDNPDPTQATTTQTFDELSSGYNFVLGVNTAGEVYAWGENSSGQLGQGTYTSSNVPVIVPTLTGIKTVSTTESSSMAVTSAGDVYVWGNNSVGQLGTGNTSVINFPFLNTAIANTDTIAGGRNHFVILKNDGTVWTVGNNSYGQLGQGNLVSSMSPVQVTALSNVVAVGAGEYHSFAIDNTGDLYVWGNNGSGQLGLNDLNNRLSPTVSPLRNVISAQGGANHSAYLTSDKKVFTSGGNAFGQLGTGNLTPSTTATEINISGAEMISTGQYTTLVLRSDRSVFGFGNNTEDQLSSLSGNTVSTPEHIVDLDGVGFIEASQLSSHVIYNESHACVSAPVDVNMITVPLVTISANGDTLSTVAGVSYQWYFNGLSIPGANSQTYVANESGDYTVEVGFASGCSGTSAPYYHSLSGIEDVVSGEISLYPNPAYDKLNLELFNTGDATSLVMVDQTGRLVLEMNNLPDGKHIFNVSELSDGVYMIHLKYEDGASSTLRFVKSTL